MSIQRELSQTSSWSFLCFTFPHNGFPLWTKQNPSPFPWPVRPQESSWLLPSLLCARPTSRLLVPKAGQKPFPWGLPDCCPPAWSTVPHYCSPLPTFDLHLNEELTHPCTLPKTSDLVLTANVVCDPSLELHPRLWFLSVQLVLILLGVSVLNPQSSLPGTVGSLISLVARALFSCLLFCHKLQVLMLTSVRPAHKTLRQTKHVPTSPPPSSYAFKIENN